MNSDLDTIVDFGTEEISTVHGNASDPDGTNYIAQLIACITRYEQVIGLRKQILAGHLPARAALQVFLAPSDHLATAITTSIKGLHSFSRTSLQSPQRLTLDYAFNRVFDRALAIIVKKAPHSLRKAFSAFNSAVTEILIGAGDTHEKVSDKDVESARAGLHGALRGIWSYREAREKILAN